MIVLAHREDETCAAMLRDTLRLVNDLDVVVLVASADALADDAIFQAAKEALQRGQLWLFLWRPCLVDVLCLNMLAFDGPKGTRELRRTDPNGPWFYPVNGTWLTVPGQEITPLEAAQQMRTDLVITHGRARVRTEGSSSL